MRRICFLILLAISVDTHAARFGLLDAVRETLARNPDVQLNAKQLEISQGAAREAAGAFDPVLALSAGQSHASTPLNRYQRATYSALGQPVSRANSTTTTYALSLDRTLRSGVVLSPGVSATHSIGTDNDAYGLAAQNRGRVGFDLRVPLGRGGRDSTEAPEAAARLEAEASREDLRFSVAQAVLASVSAYWNLLAAEKSLEVAREAEAGIDRLLEDTRKLIAADERPAADLLLIRAPAGQTFGAAGPGTECAGGPAAPGLEHGPAVRGHQHLAGGGRFSCRCRRVAPGQPATAVVRSGHEPAR